MTSFVDEDNTTKDLEAKVDTALFTIFSQDNVGMKISKDEENTIDNPIKNLLNSIIGSDAMTQNDKKNYCIKLLVKAAIERRRCVRPKILLRYLEAAVKDHCVGAKVVCEAILSSNLLKVDQPQIWVEAFGVVRKIINLVDYKGVRDLLKHALCCIKLLPNDSSFSHSACIDAVYCVIEYIINRNNCLLPGFLAVNEISSRYHSEEKPWPHWQLGQLLADYMQSFRLAAKLLTVSGRNFLRPVVGISPQQCNSWKLAHLTGVLKLVLAGPLPWDKSLTQPQNGLVRYVLKQNGCNVYIMHMLSLQVAKQNKIGRCISLENEIIEIIMDCLLNVSNEIEIEILLQRISSVLIFLVMYHFVNFPNMVQTLSKRLHSINTANYRDNIRQGRDNLMWFLLQFLSGSLPKLPVNELLPFLKVIDVLYGDDEELKIPDITKSNCVRQFAAVSIWVHILLRASNAGNNDTANLNRKVPVVLSLQYRFLEDLYQTSSNLSTTDYRLVLLANAYSTKTESLQSLLNIFLDDIAGQQDGSKIKIAGDIDVPYPIKPFSIEFLDSWTVHAKMSFVHLLVRTKILINKSSHQQQLQVRLSPALVETYSRLLLYNDIETFGIKAFVQQFYPHVISKGNWEILHVFIDMAANRLNFIALHHIVGLLIHSLQFLNMGAPHSQLQASLEGLSLRFILRLNESFFNKIEPTENEEINRVMVMSLARAIHLSCADGSNTSLDFLNSLWKKTPILWSSQTLESFPPTISDFFQKSQQTHPGNDINILVKNVELELKRWRQNSSDINSWIDDNAQPYFLCVLYKLLKEDRSLPLQAHDMLEHLKPKALSNHVRKLSDYVVIEFSSTGHIQQMIEALNELIWKLHAFPLEKFVLCLSLRQVDGVDPQVAFNVLQQLLFKPPELRLRISDWVKEVNPSHWIDQSKTDHEVHTEFHNKYPEKWPVGSAYQSIRYLPTYYSSVCSRFIPCFDVLIHRCIEVEQATQCFYKLIEHLGKIYKLHRYPITFLYETLFYYERVLCNHYEMKRTLVATVNSALKETKPPNWSFTNEFEKNVLSVQANGWKLSMTYILIILKRLVDTLADKNVFPEIDWRFNEITNVKAHCVYVSSIELMTLQESSSDIGQFLIDSIVRTVHDSREEAMQRVNAVGLLLSNLPEAYSFILNEMIVENIRSLPTDIDIISFDFYETQSVDVDTRSGRLIAVTHSFWQHASIGQLSSIPLFIREKIRPIIKYENQFLFVCKLIGPFLYRFVNERTRCVLELTVELYEMLERVDRFHGQNLQCMDTISDFFYDIKYMYVGDGVRNEVDKIISRLHNSALKSRLSFISHQQGREQDD